MRRCTSSGSVISLWVVHSIAGPECAYRQTPRPVPQCSSVTDATAPRCACGASAVTCRRPTPWHSYRSYCGSVAETVDPQRRARRFDASASDPTALSVHKSARAARGSVLAHLTRASWHRRSSPRHRATPSLQVATSHRWALSMGHNLRPLVLTRSASTRTRSRRARCYAWASHGLHFSG